MISMQLVKRGLLFFVSGKLVSGLLGVFWLTSLVRALDKNSLGIYLTVLSLFEIGQLFSSVGLYSFIQRYLPQAYVTFSRNEFRKLLFSVIGARIVTLAILGSILLITWTQLNHWQAWPIHQLNPWVVVAFVLLEGTIRFLDGVFECVIQQAYSQLVSVIRNLLRIVWLGALMFLDHAVTVMTILELEVTLAGVFLILGLIVLAKQVKSIPIQSVQVHNFNMKRAIRYSWSGYAALAVGQFCSMDALRLLVGHFCGAATVATYGLAQAISDIVRRYMPMQLFLGFIRAVIVAKFELNRNADAVAQQAALLHKLNAFFLFGVAGWGAACGSSAIQLLTKNQGFGESGPFFVGFLMLIGIQALRMVLALLATVQEDGRSILIATALSCFGMLFAWFSIPKIGPWGAIFGAVLSEVIYVLVLKLRLKVTLVSFLGGVSPYIRMSLLAGVSALIIISLHWQPHDVFGLIVQSFFFGLIYLSLLRVWRPFLEQERLIINKLLPIKAFVW